jgi:hypothetical protein
MEKPPNLRLQKPSSPAKYKPVDTFAYFLAASTPPAEEDFITSSDIACFSARHQRQPVDFLSGPCAAAQTLFWIPTPCHDSQLYQ